MNPILNYQSRRRWLTWAAFGCAAAIHLGAIVIAQGKAEKVSAPNLPLDGVDVVMGDERPPESLPEEQETVLPPVLPSDPDPFPPENPTPVRVRKEAIAPVVRKIGAAAQNPARFGSIKALAINAPRPDYPYEARRQGTTGSGIALLIIDPQTGNVLDARMTFGTGSIILDNATLTAFKRWRFHPGAVTTVQVPITYTLTGASY